MFCRRFAYTVSALLYFSIYSFDCNLRIAHADIPQMDFISKFVRFLNWRNYIVAAKCCFSIVRLSFFKAFLLHFQEPLLCFDLRFHASPIRTRFPHKSIRIKTHAQIWGSVCNIQRAFPRAVDARKYCENFNPLCTTSFWLRCKR